MKKIVAIILIIYIVVGTIFYLQALTYSRSVVSIGTTPQQLSLVQELPTTLTMIFLWPFLILGQAINQ
jgi:hypothetical protein